MILFVTFKVPPFITRLVLLCPVIVIPDVSVVKSKRVELPEIRTRRIPSLVNVNTLVTAPDVQASRWPTGPVFVTVSVAPLRPVIVKFGSRVIVSPGFKSVQLVEPATTQVYVTVP